MKLAVRRLDERRLVISDSTVTGVEEMGRKGICDVDGSRVIRFGAWGY